MNGWIHSWFATCRLAIRVSLLAVALVALPGCELFGMMATALVPPSKPAVYTIANRPTVVIVDDPNNQLKDPQLALLAAANATELFRSEEVITQLIDTEKLTALAIELGDRYPKTSPYDIGARLGAKQVLLVHIFAASMSPEPSMIRPIAEVGVKLFDVDTKERVFPPSSNLTGTPDRPKTEGFHIQKVTLRVKIADTNPGRVELLARQRLAEEIGKSAALLFFEHDPTKYDDIRAGN